MTGQYRYVGGINDCVSNVMLIERNPLCLPVPAVQAHPANRCFVLFCPCGDERPLERLAFLGS